MSKNTLICTIRVLSAQRLVGCTAWRYLQCTGCSIRCTGCSLWLTGCSKMPFKVFYMHIKRPRHMSRHKNLHPSIDYLHNIQRGSKGRLQRPTWWIQFPIRCTLCAQRHFNVASTIFFWKILKNLLTSTRNAHNNPFSIFNNYNVFDFYFYVQDAPSTNVNKTIFAFEWKLD